MKQTLALLPFVWLCAAPCAAAQPAAGDALPPRSFLRIGTSKLRHGDRILCLAYSPDGKVLAAGGGNDPLRLWNAKTGDAIQVINEPWVHAVAYNKKGTTLFLGGAQRTIRRWNMELNKEAGRRQGHKAAITALAVSPDDSALVSAGQDGAIIVWRLDTLSEHGTYKGHTGEVTTLAFSPDSNIFASAGADRTIRIWDIRTNQTRVKIDAGCYVFAIAFSPDGKTLYSAGDDNLIRRWDAATGKSTGTFKGHDGSVVSLIAQGDAVISGSLDKTIRIWDAKTTKLRQSIARSHGDCDALAITDAGDFLATAGLNNVIRIFDAKTGKEVIHAPGVQAPLVGLTLSPDQKRLASITSDGQSLIWDAKTGKPQIQWDTRQSGDSSIAFAPDGKSLVVADSTVRFWNVANGLAVAEFPVKVGDRVVSFAFAPDGKTLALGLHSNTIELWDLKARKTIGNFKYPGPLYAVAWSPDGKKLAAAGGPKIFVWDPRSGTLLKSFDVKEGPIPGTPTIRSLAFGPESKTLAAGGWDAVIRIYNLDAKNPTDLRDQRICEGHLSAVFALAFSNDGRTLVSGSFDRTVRLWEAFSGKQVGIYRGHVGAVHGVAFSNDGRSFFSAATDSTVFCWDVPGLANNGKLPELTLPYGELNTAWDLLASEETPRGHEAMWRCIASARQAVPHLAKKVFLLDPERVRKLFRDLDSIHFPTRLAAMKELGDPVSGRWMEGRYDTAIANASSLEYRRRVELLKEKLDATKAISIAAERLRVRRFMLICEQAGGPEAIAALQKIADRGPEEELREEARGSLQRLKK